MTRGKCCPEPGPLCPPCTGILLSELIVAGLVEVRLDEIGIAYFVTERGRSFLERTDKTPPSSVGALEAPRANRAA